MERPRIFSAPEVRAILAGAKTQARRLVDLDATPEPSRWWEVFSRYRSPVGYPPDRLWVREPFRLCAEADATRPRDTDPAYRIWYEADAPHQPGAGRLRAAMSMPRWASRITLEITDVRVERLQAIDEAAAAANGFGTREFPRALGPFGTKAAQLPCIHCGQRRDRHVGSALACFGGSGSVWNGSTARGGFAWEWERRHGLGSWAANPWVWVVDFRRVVA